MQRYQPEQAENQFYDVRALQKHASNAEYVANVEGGGDYYAAIWFMVLLMLSSHSVWLDPSVVRLCQRSSYAANWRMASQATMQFQLLLRIIYGTVTRSKMYFSARSVRVGIAH